MSTTQRNTPASDAAVKGRIISHMNKDHSSSLRDYLEYYSHLPASIAATAELVDISLTQLTISTRASPTGTTTTYVPIRPAPMESLSDARERMVFMHHEALEGLGKSPYVVDFYSPPKTAVQWAAVVFVLFGFYSFSPLVSFAEGSFHREYVLFGSATLAGFFEKYQTAALVGMIVIHAAEVMHMERSRLRKHQTPRFSSVWWKWIGGTFIEGFMSFLRFDEAVEAIKAKKLKEKH